MTQPAPGWFAPGATADDATVHLVCLPHAGAGASAYRTWTVLGRHGIDVLPVQLTGREARYAERPVTSAADVVDRLVGPLLARVDRPVALLGHSMGALLAYELAHALTAAGVPPVHLFVSGYRAPSLERLPEVPVVHALPDDELLRWVELLEGTPPEVLAQPELVQLLLPVLRADYALCETYRFRPRPALDVPMTALGGTGDAGLGPDGLTGWRELTTGEVTIRRFPGGHFYLSDRLADVHAEVLRALVGVPARQPAEENAP